MATKVNVGSSRGCTPGCATSARYWPGAASGTIASSGCEVSRRKENLAAGTLHLRHPGPGGSGQRALAADRAGRRLPLLERVAQPAHCLLENGEKGDPIGQSVHVRDAELVYSSTRPAPDRRSISAGAPSS